MTFFCKFFFLFSLSKYIIYIYIYWINFNTLLSWSDLQCQQICGVPRKELKKKARLTLSAAESYPLWHILTLTGFKVCWQIIIYNLWFLLRNLSLVCNRSAYVIKLKLEIFYSHVKLVYIWGSCLLCIWFKEKGFATGFSIHIFVFVTIFLFYMQCILYLTLSVSYSVEPIDQFTNTLGRLLFNSFSSLTVAANPH